MRSRRRTDGFTHVEILLAIAIMAVAAACAYESLRGGLRLLGRVQLTVRDAADRGAAEAILARDLRSAYLSAADRRTIFAGRTDAAGIDRLDFVRTGADGLEREVGYRLERDARSGRWDLWRREQPGLDADPLEGGASAPICRGIAAMRLRYFDGDQWRDSWGWDSMSRRPTLGVRGLPLAVAVELSLDDGDERGKRVTVCPIMVPLMNRSLHA